MDSLCSIYIYTVNNFILLLFFNEKDQVQQYFVCCADNVLWDNLSSHVQIINFTFCQISSDRQEREMLVKCSQVSGKISYNVEPTNDVFFMHVIVSEKCLVYSQNGHIAFLEVSVVIVEGVRRFYQCI